MGCNGLDKCNLWRWRCAPLTLPSLENARSTGQDSCLQEKTNYKSILYKTYYVMEYAVAHYDVRFVLKTDDDAFINVQPLMNQLKLLCETPDCGNERIYMVGHLSPGPILTPPPFPLWPCALH